MNLFNQKILRERIARFDFPSGEKATEIQKLIANWQYALKDRDLTKTKEKSVQGQFLLKFFGEILDYPAQTDNQEQWNLIQHPTTEVDAQEADGSLGFFTKENKITKAVIELKDAKTSLDKKQSGREKGYTPIEQGYLYSTKFDRCNWIIVANFREIRLYNKNRTQDYYEKFDVLALNQEDEFKRFYYILCKQNLISDQNTSIVDDLANSSTKEDENITLKFYTDYKNLRLELYNHLLEHNQQIEKTFLLEKAQKILDRFIFILFCEDTGNLLPRNLVKDTYDLGIRSRERSDERVWREFKNLFMDIDIGRSDIDPKINRYNGGLFAKDDILDKLTIKDNVWKKLVDLDKYDFESELNVNILGHIFEQSISDLEALKVSLFLHKEDGGFLLQENGSKLLLEQEGTQIVEKKGRRKKEGIFYTPEFITQYLTEDVIGRFLEENPNKLETIKILDPACGSGAFLNQAHAYLMQEYKTRYEQMLLEKAGDRQLSLTDVNLAETNRSILLNNLFGVDLNQESVEITKLSLWLKTARSSEPLQNLDKNIKCGNSIVDDPQYADSKAFQWEKEYKEILDEGGFDVVIGNPPYVRQELFKEIKPYLEKNYEVYTGVSDLYVYFFEKALSLLKDGGYFAFIVSNKFIRAEYGKKLTQYLQKNFTLLELIDFGDLQIFEGATTYPCIITIQKKKPADIQKVPFLKLTTLDSVSNLGLSLKENNQTIEIKSENTSWQLRSVEQNALMNKLINNKKTIDDYLSENFYRGVVTGYNDAFIIDSETKNKLCSEDSKNSDIIKPLLRGKDIKRYSFHYNSIWLIFTRRGINIDEYPSIKRHLEQFKEKLEPGKGRKAGSYQWFEIQDNIAYYQEFEKPKIIWGNLSTKASFMFDDENYFINAPACIMPTNEKWLVGLLNSSVINFFLINTAIERQGGFIEQKPVYVKQIPIPELTEIQKLNLEKNVVRMIKLQKKLHDEIDRSVELIINEYKFKKNSSKLEKFYELGWNELTEELENQKIKLDLKQKDELSKWFRSKKASIKNLLEEINIMDDDINNMIYDAFSLSPEEKMLVNNFR